MKKAFFSFLVLACAWEGTRSLAAAAGAGTVSLPPFFVNDTAYVHWEYAQIPGFEILSRCGDRTTEDFAKKVFREQSLLDAIVPPDLQAGTVVPTALIVLNKDMKNGLAQTMIGLTQANARRVSQALADSTGVSSLYVRDAILQVKLSDADSTGVDMILDDPDNDWTRPANPPLLAVAAPDYDEFTFKPEYLFSILARRAPALPPWFVEGVLNFRYSEVGDNFYVAAVNQGERDKVVRVRSVFWLSEEATALLRPLMISADIGVMGGITSSKYNYPDVPHILWPVRELLTGPPPVRSTDTNQQKQAWLDRVWEREVRPYPHPKLSDYDALLILHGADADSPWRFDVWRTEAALLLRWAFEDKSPVRRRALWEFVRRASVQPVTEKMFKECFGLSFAKMDRKLYAYLEDTAVRYDLDLLPDNPGEIPPVEEREATEAEKARILGDWERKEFEFVQASHPEYARDYARQAERTLLSAYDHGGRDPGLLAAIGLYECALGDDARARPFLEEAVQARVERPRAYVELARIRFATALAKPTGADGKLGSDQVASVLDLVKDSRSQSPPQLGAYLLAALVWQHAAAAPAPADLALLDEGVDFFPRSSQLLLAVARLKVP